MGVSPVVVGVFKEEDQAENAIDVLRNVGFSYDQIFYAMHKHSWGMNPMLDYLAKMGVPDEEVSYYVSEFEAGRSVVLVRHDGRLGEVLNILFLNGTRKHRYLNAGRHTGKPAPEASVSLEHGLNGRRETSQAYSSNNALKNSAICNTDCGSEVTEQGEMASLRKLLKDVGLDHLL